MAKLFVNSGDPDQTPRSGSALFAIYPFTGLPTTVGQSRHKRKICLSVWANTSGVGGKFCPVLDSTLSTL